MSASAFVPGSRMILTEPGPSQVAEMKIQPALERVNVNGLPDLGMEEASSNSETTLFSFFSPENRIFASETPAWAPKNADKSIEVTGFMGEQSGRRKPWTENRAT